MNREKGTWHIDWAKQKKKVHFPIEHNLELSAETK